LLGIPVSAVNYGAAIEEVLNAVHEWRPLAVDATNTMGLAASCRDPELRRAMLSYDMLLPDGMPLVWHMKAKGVRVSDRVYGPYFVEALLASLPRRVPVGLVGGYSHMHRALAHQAQVRFPGVELVLMDDSPMGHISERLMAESVARVRESGARLVFVCLGVPRQYLWTAAAKPLLPQTVLVSVGGAFDFITGVKEYAPRWMQRSGLTWLHRTVKEPKRLLPRYVKYNALFLWYLLTRELLPERVRPSSN
jgi:N-acetylglucosaminyldiphosphoundecaprenol N-acetyl-beta-D-mannosaminyltransferase